MKRARTLALTITSFWASVSQARLAFADEALKPKAAQSATTAIAVGPDRKVQAYRLESVEIQGSTRLRAKDLSSELNLVKGMPLDDTMVMSTRSRLLGLGLFKSVILVMRRGREPGYAKLVIEVEDDDNILTDWALGGELDVSLSENSASTADPNSAPMDYRLGIVGRNLFKELHRGSLFVDIDSTGKFEEGQLAYGLPRFTLEDVQFDAEAFGVNIRHRYLDALGFGGRGEGLWSRTVNGLGEIQYGAAMYVNKGPDFALTGFPSAVAGPKVAYFRETRLRGFYPGTGHMIGASLVLAPTQTEKSLLELDLARTFALGDYVYFTLDGRALSVGVDGYSFRGESRVDVPIGSQDPREDQAEFFIRLRGGHDVIGQTNLVGSSAIIGVRYHSSGFIAELALKVTRSPAEFDPTKKLSGAVKKGDAGAGLAP